MFVCQSQPFIEEMDPKKILKGGLMFDVKYMLDNNIMEQSELEKVIERRNLFLKKINNNNVNREDYMAHIHEQLKLMDFCKFNFYGRLQAEEILSDYSKAMSILTNDVDYKYSSMLQMYPINLSSLEDYISFRFINKSYISDETNLLHQVMAVKHEDPEVYKTAALFEYFKMNDVASARLCFSEGLKFHKNCKMLLSEDLNLEVQCIEDTNGESLPFALNKYKYMAKCFKGDLEFHFTMLDLVLRFNSIRELQYHVVSDMFVEYKQDEKMWQKLALVNLCGFIFDYDLKKLYYDQHCKCRLLYSIKVFDDGLKEDWSPEKRKILWNMFIDHMIAIWKENGVKNETISSYVHETMERVFQGALNEGFLYKAEHYAYWAVCNNEGRHEILSKAIEMNKNNIDTWIEILSVYAEVNSSEMIKKVLKYAVMALGPETIPLWQLVERYVIKHGIVMLIHFYYQAVYAPYPLISMMFRPKLLKWFGLTNGISNIRKLFNELNTLSPPCKQLYVDMISYEQTVGNFNKTRISKLYNTVCYTMGHGDVQLWANYIQFEYTHVDQYSAKNIYKSSLEYLGPDLFRVLTIKFENIKQEYYDKNTRTIDPDIIDVDEA